jgi:hypothetical protein
MDGCTREFKGIGRENQISFTELGRNMGWVNVNKLNWIESRTTTQSLLHQEPY